jgi:hypothetical protein
MRLMVQALSTIGSAVAIFMAIASALLSTRTAWTQTHGNTCNNYCCQQLSVACTHAVGTCYCTSEMRCSKQSDGGGNSYRDCFHGL